MQGSQSSESLITAWGGGGGHLYEAKTRVVLEYILEKCHILGSMGWSK